MLQSWKHDLSTLTKLIGVTLGIGSIIVSGYKVTSWVEGVQTKTLAMIEHEAIKKFCNDLIIKNQEITDEKFALIIIGQNDIKEDIQEQRKSIQSIILSLSRIQE